MNYQQQNDKWLITYTDSQGQLASLLYPAAVRNVEKYVSDGVKEMMTLDLEKIKEIFSSDQAAETISKNFNPDHYVNWELPYNNMSPPLIEVTSTATTSTSWNFYYRRGRVTTTNPWSQPTFDKIKEYITDVKNNTDIFDRYDAYVLGSVLYNINQAWDLDLHILGNYSSTESLEDDLDLLLDIGLNQHNLLIDPIWVPESINDISAADIEDINFRSSFNSSIGTTNVLKKVNDHVILNHRRTDGEFLTENLFRANVKVYDHFTNKPVFIAAIRNPKNIPVLRRLNYQDIITMTHQEFHTRTNIYL